MIIIIQKPDLSSSSPGFLSIECKLEMLQLDKKR